MNSHSNCIYNNSPSGHHYFISGIPAALQLGGFKIVCYAVLVN